MLATYFHKKQHSTKVALLHRPIFRANSTNEIWKAEGLCWKSNYRFDRVVDLPVDALGLILLCVWEENMSVHQILLSKRETMLPILNLSCLFKMQIPWNKDSDCTGCWKLGTQLWVRPLCTSTTFHHPSEGRVTLTLAEIMLFSHLLHFIRRRDRRTNQLQLFRSWPRFSSRVYLYRKTLNLRGITRSYWTHWILCNCSK